MEMKSCCLNWILLCFAFVKRTKFWGMHVHPVPPPTHCGVEHILVWVCSVNRTPGWYKNCLRFPHFLVLLYFPCQLRAPFTPVHWFVFPALHGHLWMQPKLSTACSHSSPAYFSQVFRPWCVTLSKPLWWFFSSSHCEHAISCLIWATSITTTCTFTDTVFHTVKGILLFT